jgi:hypothetical protein
MHTSTRQDTHTHKHSRVHTQTHARTEICNTYYFSTATLIRERASMLRYTNTACLLPFPFHSASKYFLLTFTPTCFRFHFCSVQLCCQPSSDEKNVRISGGCGSHASYCKSSCIISNCLVRCGSQRILIL